LFHLHRWVRMNYPEESIQHSVHGESLKSRIILDFYPYYYYYYLLIELDD
jgi:hypothetical protein